jgi:hypothetical protein
MPVLMAPGASPATISQPLCYLRAWGAPTTRGVSRVPATVVLFLRDADST